MEEFWNMTSWGIKVQVKFHQSQAHRSRDLNLNYGPSPWWSSISYKWWSWINVSAVSTPHQECYHIAFLLSSWITWLQFNFWIRRPVLPRETLLTFDATSNIRIHTPMCPGVCPGERLLKFEFYYISNVVALLWHAWPRHDIGRSKQVSPRHYYCPLWVHRR